MGDEKNINSKVGGADKIIYRTRREPINWNHLKVEVFLSAIIF